VEEYGRAREATDNNIIRRMRIAGWIPKATNTYTEYVIFIVFPLQQRLHLRASILRCTCTLPVLLFLDALRFVVTFILFYLFVLSFGFLRPAFIPQAHYKFIVMINFS
jgi:hypothetical protein